jgi:ribosomal protein S18 acetylase RimI-like enzyme
MEIVKLKLEDWEKFRDLRLEALKEDSAAFGESYEERLGMSDEEVQIRIKKENNLILIANEKGNPIGMIGVNFEEGEKVSHIAYVWGMYVNKDYRNQGIGKKLFGAMLAEIQKNEKIKKINLNVNTQQTSAVKLYESFGFKIAGTLHEELKIGEEYFDEYAMEKLF